MQQFLPRTLCLMFVACASVVADRVVTIGTSLGLITGDMMFVPSNLGFPRKFMSFRGIPYARPPLGKRRWKDPEPIISRSGQMNARNFGPPCPQFEEATGAIIGQEDCLYLNVYVPVRNQGDSFASGHPPFPIRHSSKESPKEPRRRKRRNEPRNNTTLKQFPPSHPNGLPVLVFIHGGDFISGSSSIFGPEKLMDKSVILVTFNYRLGILGNNEVLSVLASMRKRLGFMSTGDFASPGNYGLADQIMALQWVKANIEEFGGNPDRITLMGQGSGAASAHYLLMSPRGQDLFHQVILQSGAATCEWAFESNPYLFAKALAYSLSCAYLITSSLVDCLRGKPFPDLIRKQQDDMTLAVLPLKTVPVVDKETRASPIVLRPPRDTMEMKDGIRQMPTIIGQNKDEGLALLLQIYLERKDLMGDQSYVRNYLIREIIGSYYNNFYDASKLSRAVQEQYFDDVNLDNQNEMITSFTKMLTDMTVTSCVQHTFRKLVDVNPTRVFSYVFSYRSFGSPTWAYRLIQEAQKTGLNDNFFYTAVSHGDELSYLFQVAPSHPIGRLLPFDHRISQLMTSAWAGFVQFGIPIIGLPPGTYPPWIPATRGNWLTYNISFLDNSFIIASMILDYKQQESKFWHGVLPYVASLSSWVTWMERWRYDVLFWIFLALCLILIVGLIVLGVALKMSRRSTTVEFVPSSSAKGRQL